MKLIYEPSYQTAIHRRRIADLTDENASLKQKVSDLEAVINLKHEEKLRQIQDGPPPVKSSYTMNTTASWAWGAQNPPFCGPNSVQDTESSFGSNSSQYNDDGWPSTAPSTAPSSAPSTAILPSYMRSTTASRAKAVVTQDNTQSHSQPEEAEPEENKQENQDVVGTQDDGFDWGFNSDQDPLPEEISQTHEPEEASPPEQPTSLSDAEWHLMLERRLGSKYTLTQYIDEGWLRTPAGRVQLRSKFVKALQAEALALGAETWHAWGLVHTPAFMAAHAPSGPWDLLVDRAALIRLGVGMFPSGALSGAYFAGHAPVRAHVATHLVFHGLGGGLRNTTCHFDFAEHTWARDVHRLVYPVLELARELRDGARARRAEDLLARLRREAEDTHADIGRRMLLAALPGAQPWEYHHEALFDTVLRKIEGHAYDQLTRPGDCWGWLDARRQDDVLGYGSTVIRAAFEYGRHGRSAGMAGLGLGLAWEGDKEVDPDSAFGYRHSSWSRGEWWPEINQNCRWEKTTSTRRRRLSVHGADMEGMEKADTVKDSRWKCRRDPRSTLNGLDLALTF